MHWLLAHLLMASVATPVQVTAPGGVNAVNGQNGDVSIVTYQRQVSGPLDASSGVVNWQFPVPFKSTPTCFEQLSTTSTAVSYDAPLVVASDTNSVTYKVSAHYNVVNITLGMMSVTVQPPAGTNITLSCIAPN